MGHEHTKKVALIYYSDSLLQSKTTGYTSKAGLRRSESVLNCLCDLNSVKCVNTSDLLPEMLVCFCRSNPTWTRLLLLPWIPSILLLIAIRNVIGATASHRLVFLLYNYPASLLPVLPLLAILKFKIVIQVEEISRPPTAPWQVMGLRKLVRWASMVIWFQFSSGFICPYNYKYLFKYTKPVLVLPLV